MRSVRPRTGATPGNGTKDCGKVHDRAYARAVGPGTSANVQDASTGRAALPSSWISALLVWSLTPWASFVIHPLAAEAAPQALTAAQQAFARLDYANSYKSALEALRTSPKSLDARRIAAKSAKELNRAPECLKLMQDGGFDKSNSTSDDVNLVGECSALSQYSSWSLSYLQSNVGVSANRDIAAFWLGRFFYRKGDYMRAEKALSSVAVLPARLEKERQFMLERTREVLSATQAAQPQPQPSPSGAGSASEGPNGTSGTPSKSSSKDKEKDKDKERDKDKETSSSRQAHRTDAAREVFSNAPKDGGAHFTYSAIVDAGVAMFRGSKTPIGPGDQTKFEEALRANNPNATLSIESKTEDTNDLFIDLRLAAAAGWASAQSGRGGQTRIGLGVAAGATQSAFVLPFYAPLGESMRANTPARFPTQGYAVDAVPFFDFAANRNLALGAEVGYGYVAPGFEGLRARLWGEGYVKLAFDEFELKPSGRYLMEMGRNGDEGALSGLYGMDFRIHKLGFFGLGAPGGYPLVRYSWNLARGSDDVVLFTRYEGDFWEFNIAPRAYLNDAFTLMTWYRYVIGSEQSYVSGSKADAVARLAQGRGGAYKAFQPDAEFSSVLSDWTTRLDWAPPGKWWSLGAGIVIHRMVTTFGEYDTGLDKTLRYNQLLDRGKEDWSRYFVSGRMSF